MMARVATQIRIDEAVKQDAVALFNQLGIDMSAAVNIFLRQCLIHKGLPFQVKAYDCNAETIAAMDAAVKETDIYGPFATVEEMKEALDA